MSAYEMLAQCIRSGQMDAREVADAFRDQVFTQWYARRFG
jgi:hypothetical protein